MDGYFYKLYKAEHKPESLGYSELSYLMMRSYYRDYKFSADTRESYNYYMSLADKKETYDLNLWFRAQLALLMTRESKNEQAHDREVCSHKLHSMAKKKKN